jgi:hypothetical protein
MSFVSPTVATYPSLAAFYAADPRRRPSPELDVGLWWREGDGAAAARAAWVRATGELIVVRYGAGGAVEVLAIVHAEGDLHCVVAGWEDVCGEAGSLRWLRIRAACWPYAWAE